MFLSRNTFYWLWFTLFGVIASLVAFTQTAHVSLENLWLLVAGGVGVLLNAKSLVSQWSKPYDALIGVIFSAAGWIGILHNFGVNIINNSSFLSINILNETRFLGLSLLLSPALLHSALGFLALKYATRNPAQMSSLEVGTSEKS